MGRLSRKAKKPPLPGLERQAEWLEAKRREFGWTYEEAGAACGVSQAAFQKWAHGYFPIPKEKLASMAHGLGVDEPFLMRLAGYPLDGSTSEPEPQTAGELFARVQADLARLARVLDRDAPLNAH